MTTFTTFAPATRQPHGNLLAGIVAGIEAAMAETRLRVGKSSG